MITRRRRKKKKFLGLQGLEMKKIESPNKTIVEKLTLVVSHTACAVAGAWGGSVLGKWGGGASFVTVMGGILLAPKYPVFATHLIAGGSSMWAGPAIVSDRPQTVEGINGMDISQRLDQGLERGKSFLTSGVSKSFFLDEWQKPSDSIEEEAAKAKSGGKELGRVVKYNLPSAEATPHKEYSSFALAI